MGARYAYHQLVFDQGLRHDYHGSRLADHHEVSKGEQVESQEHGKGNKTTFLCTAASIHVGYCQATDLISNCLFLIVDEHTHHVVTSRQSTRKIQGDESASTN